jgi:glutaredoxin
VGRLMVDWDRVAELRSKGWDWDRIADDPKVGFHPDASVREPGRALRALYHRQKSRERRQGPSAPTPKKAAEEEERRWTLPRVGYLLTPVFGIWFVIAYLVPSPVGLILPALPYLALALAVAAFLLLFGLWRSEKARWSKLFRTTLVTGVVLGLLISAMIAVGGLLFFGCPYLPSAGSATSQPGQGWTSVSVSPWQDSGRPVVYYYAATWCPYCSASSWALWKALTEFGTVSGAYTDYSSPSDVYASTPEIVLANAQFSSTSIAFQVSEDTSGNDGTFPGTSNCYQQAYFSAYGGNSIPFLVINGQYIHGGSSLLDPAKLQSWAGSGATTVQQSVASESGQPWSYVQDQACWVMAFMAKSTGESASALASQYHWSSAVQSAVALDMNSIR